MAAGFPHTPPASMPSEHRADCSAGKQSEKTDLPYTPDSALELGDWIFLLCSATTIDLRPAQAQEFLISGWAAAFGSECAGPVPRSGAVVNSTGHRDDQCDHCGDQGEERERHYYSLQSGVGDGLTELGRRPDISCRCWRVMRNPAITSQRTAVRNV
jgi:hypothetical protein